jgi:hypothetical protein
MEMPMRRIRSLVVVTAVMALFGVGGWALADDNRVDWDCPGTPNPPGTQILSVCYALGGASHSWGKVDAINTADAYNKCADIVMVAVGEISQLCASATEVSTYSTAQGFCAYPNNATSGPCQALNVSVWNNTAVHHGLRGVAWY